MKRARAWIFAALAVVAGASAIALAAGTDDRAEAEATLTQLEGDAHTKTLCADPIAKSRTALERARRMRVAGDDKHARLAEGLALEWANVAKELARADAAETRAAAARSAANDAGANVERERALLEQHLAENGRLGAELTKADGAAEGGTSRARGASGDGGAHK